MHMSDHIEDLAKKLAGNFLKFESFGMASDEMPDDPENWCVVYTRTRDSGITDRSNARVIGKALHEHLVDGSEIHEITHGHWACGWCDGFLMLVRRTDGTIAPAFAVYAEIAIGLEEYPIADENDHSEEEMRDADETWANCYTDAERLDLIRNRIVGCRRFDSMADLMCCVRGGFAPDGNWGFDYLNLTY